MKKLYLILFVVICNTFAVLGQSSGIFSWGADGSYPVGGVSGYTYTDVDPALIGSTTVSSITVGSAVAWQTNYPRVLGSYTAGNQCGPNSGPSRFGLGVNFSTNSQTNASISFTLTFPTPVRGLYFNIYNIDTGVLNAGIYDFVDEVIVSAVNDSGTPVGPPGLVLSPSVSSSTSGTAVTLTGTSQDPSSSPGSATTLTYGATTYVKTITFTYRTGPNAKGGANGPDPQLISIGCMQWAGPLPVTLTAFTSKTENNSVKLDWVTSFETNSDNFEVERSINAQSFERIGHIKASNESNDVKKYSFIDDMPFEGWNYYRLKVNDIDGKFEYSRIIASEFKQNNTYFEIVSTQTNGTILVKTNGEEPVFEMYDLTGRSILKQTENIGRNLYKLTSLRPSLMTIVRGITLDGESFTKKLILED